MRPRRAMALLAGVLLLASCARPPVSARPAERPSIDIRGSWTLVELLRDGRSTPLPAGGQGTLDVGAQELGGSSFCNGFGSTYRLDGDALILDAIGGTEMGCAPDLMAAELAYLDALRVVDTAAVEDGELLLRGQGAELRFQRMPAEPDRELVGTRWVLETLVDGELASSTLGEPAVLVLAADGGLSGSTGCRPLSGRWAQTDDLLVFPQLEAHGGCPADVRPQEDHLMAVLGGETTAAVDGDQLTLTGGDGRGLVYRAE